jgi:hypothetical protein
LQALTFFVIPETPEALSGIVKVPTLEF